MFISNYGNLVHTQLESCALEFGATSKTVGLSMAQLLTAANQGNESARTQTHMLVTRDIPTSHPSMFIPMVTQGDHGD